MGCQGCWTVISGPEPNAFPLLQVTGDGITSETLWTNDSGLGMLFLALLIFRWLQASSLESRIPLAPHWFDSLGWELHHTNTGVFSEYHPLETYWKPQLSPPFVLFPHGQGTLHQCLTLAGPSLPYSRAEETPEQLQVPLR